MARGVKPNALIAAMYASKRFSNFASYGMLRKTDPGLTRGFGARFGRFLEVRFGITGNGLSSEPFRFPMANHDLPAITVPMQNSPHAAHELGSALLRDTQNFCRFGDRCRSAVINSNRVCHRL